MLTKEQYYRRPTGTEVWQRRFVECASVPGSAASWVQRGVESGLAVNNPQSKRQLARQMGAVFSEAFQHETGAEKTLEELDLEQAAAKSRVPVERLTQVAEHMVSCGVLKHTREKRS